MRILQINSHYDQGGAAKIVTYLHRQLLFNGMESFVAYGRGKKSTEQNTYCFGTPFGVYVAAFISRFVGIHGWCNRRATRRLLKLIEEIQPDIIHLHAVHGYYLNFPLLFTFINQRQIPCVWTFHDCFAFTGNCGYYFDCKRWQKGCGKCPHLQTYPKSQWFDGTKWMWKKKKELFTEGTKVIVSPSEWLTNKAKQSFFQQYPCVTIPNGIDTDNIFYPRDKGLCRSKYGYAQTDHIALGIAAGYDDERKGVKYILQLARDMEDEIRIILIGWDSKHNAVLEGITNITALPPIGDAMVLAEYYSLADVFLLPSLAENYATVSLEAMACGTPVVGFRAGGIPEQLAGGRGIAVETGNQQAFHEAVVTVLQGGGELLEREALSGQIRERNTIAHMTEQYQNLYKTIYAKPK